MNPIIFIDYEYHGYRGPLSVTPVSPPLHTTNVILRGGQELGYDIIDHKGRQQEGFSFTSLHQRWKEI